ncbi:hypothetical protein D3C85_1388330 [compost metagenome]
MDVRSQSLKITVKLFAEVMALAGIKRRLRGKHFLHVSSVDKIERNHALASFTEKRFQHSKPSLQCMLPLYEFCF